MVVPFKLTIHDQIVRIRRGDHGQTGGSRFRALLSQARHRLEIIVTLLAVLELIKRQAIRVSQDVAFGEITIEPIEGAVFGGEANGESTEDDDDS